MAEKLTEEAPTLVEATGDRGSVLDPDVVEAAALAHDLGHPPFGHAAEEVLDAELRALGDDGFEGNPQTFRILTRLSVRHSSFPGLNLTAATLRAASKYPWLRSEKAGRRKKWGAYRSDAGMLAWCSTATPEPSEQKSLEAAVMDWSDDITYAVHDVEDLFRAGLLPLDRIVVDRDETSRFLEAAFDRRERDGRPDSYTDDELEAAFETIFLSLPIARAYQNDFYVRAGLQTAVSTMIDRFISATSLELGASGMVELKIAPHAHQEVTILKELPWVYVIESPGLASQQAGVRFLVRRLFRGLLDMAADAKERSIFPSIYRTAIERADKEAGDPDDRRERHGRVVTDFISSMTDEEASRMGNRIRGVTFGSVVDLLP